MGIRIIVTPAGMKCVLLLLLVTFLAVSQAHKIDEVAREQTKLVSINDIMDHLRAFESIARANGGNRAAQNTGYNASVDYVKHILETQTNYTVTVQPFNFEITEEVSPPKLAQTAPNSVVYTRYLDYAVMSYSGSGRADALVSSVGDGCTAASFVDFTSGRIAVIARGSCDFGTKAQNAEAAGAAAVIIYNYEGEGVFSGTLGGPQQLPVLGVSHDLGVSFIQLQATLSVSVDMKVTTVYTSNVIADTHPGRADQVIVVGSHLDSVPAGPGINDNGSGSATNLELATELFKSNVTMANKVRFAWWGAEELGLLGSTYYVSQAVASGEINNIALNLNFDMLGSPNFFRGVYDGEGAAPDIRQGSVNIESLFTTFFGFEGLAWNYAAFDGRSDYGPFIENNIPAGGLFTGAEVIKPAEWRQYYGGLAKTAFDPCYHQSCDDLYNIDQEVLSQNAKAAYYALTSLTQQKFLDRWLNTAAAFRNTAGRANTAPSHAASHPFFTKA